MIWTSLLLFTVTLSSAEELTTKAQNGRQIFREGTSATGQQINARLADGEKVNAALLPCINCHGADATGREEGGFNTPDITWDALTKPYRAFPYDQRTFSLAISRGERPGTAAKETLASIMPRYSLSQYDLESLIAYLKVVDETLSSGVSDSEIVILVLLEPTESTAGFGDAIQDVLDAFFRTLNASGGVHRRMLHPRFVVLPEDPNQTMALITDAVKNTPPLAAVATYMHGYEAEVTRALDENDIPNIGSFTTLLPNTNTPRSPIFHLIPGLDYDSKALAIALSSKLKDRRQSVAVVSDDVVNWKRIAQVAFDELSRNKLVDLHSVLLSPDTDLENAVAMFERQRVDSVFLFSSSEYGRKLVNEISKTNLKPDYYSPGPVARYIFARTPGVAGSKLNFSWNTLPRDQRPRALSQFSQLFDDGGDSTNQPYQQEQLQAVAAAKILVEALIQAGYSVNRKTLTDAIEQIQGFPTGLIPEVTFGPNRRIGTGGVYVTTTDTAKRTRESQWIRLD
ncbi:MAG: ABC transporter substrate-binding protein [Gammaproteobacteria bacterium]|nr:ABC transporter substrate-binding protein [Gammaproteobacteria bacterium]